MKKKVVRKHNNSGNCFVCGLNNPFGLHSRFYELEDGTVAALVEGSVSQETLFARTAAHFSIDLHNMSRIHIFDRIFHSITTCLEETGQLECVYEGDRLCYRRPKDAALSKSPSCKGVHPAP